jgi:hypothetical protein
MTENPWTAADLGLLSLKLHVYQYQLLMAKGVVTLPEVQHLVDSLLANLRNDPGAGGVVPLAEKVLSDIKGVVIR